MIIERGPKVDFAQTDCSPNPNRNRPTQPLHELARRPYFMKFHINYHPPETTNAAYSYETVDRSKNSPTHPACLTKRTRGSPANTPS